METLKKIRSHEKPKNLDSTWSKHVRTAPNGGGGGGGAGNGLWSWSWYSMIAPVKKSVNQSRTVASVRETGWEQQQEIRLRSDSTVWSEFSFGPVGHCFLCCKQFLSAVMWSLRFPFFWSCVCHYMRFTTLRTKNETSEHVPRCPTFWLCVSV